MSVPRRGRGLCASALLGAAALTGALVGCSRSPEGGGAAAPAPIPVVVAQAVQKPMPVTLRAVGNVAPHTTVTVRARVGGVLAEVHFREGEDVTQGRTLFTLDLGPVQAQLREAEANLARTTAQLANARREAERYRTLFERGLISQSQHDQVATNAAALAASVRAERAAVENARLQTTYGRIAAPLTGRAGALQVHVGDLIQANQTALVAINQIQPIDVGFALPEQHLPEVRRYEDQGTLAVAALAPATGRELDRGHLTFIDNRVDPTTGTIQLKASFPNPDGQLWPGQFVDVALVLRVDPAAVVVPATAVQTGQEGRFVFAVRPDQTVELRPVTVAHEAGREVVIAQGVAPGDTVVVEGQLRLAPGAKVVASPGRGDAPAASPPTGR